MVNPRRAGTARLGFSIYDSRFPVPNPIVEHVCGERPDLKRREHESGVRAADRHDESDQQRSTDDECIEHPIARADPR